MDAKTINLVRNNMGAFLLKANPSYGWVSFHQDFVVPALHRVATHEIKALAILMPPRHAKSEVASINFTAWCFGRFPERKNMLISYSDRFAKRFGRKILTLITGDVHKEAFPECKLSQFARSGSYFQTTKGGEFFSAGFNGTITGAGVDGVLDIDDPIKNMNEAKSEATMLSRFEDYRSTVRTRLEGGSRLMCLTRWCRGDFFDRVIEEEGTAENGGLWHVLRVPAEAEADDPLDRQPGEFLWPERFGEPWYRANKKDLRTWNALYQQNPDANQGRRFKFEWLTFYKKRVMPLKFPAYMLTDPSKGEDPKSDPTVIGVFVATPEKRLLLVDGVVGRLDLDDNAREHIRLIRKWRPVRWLYEEYGMVRDAWFLERELKKAGVNLKPIPVGRRGPRHMLSKETRIEGLIPMFREGIICIPDTDMIQMPMIDLGEDEPQNIVDYFVNREYLEYAGDNSIDHDDFLDMMTRLQEPELGIRYPTAPAELEARMLDRKRPQIGTWESAL
jgi:hypothetical protein